MNSTKGIITGILVLVAVIVVARSSSTDGRSACFQDASTRATDLGVRVAMGECYKKYPPDPPPAPAPSFVPSNGQLDAPAKPNPFSDPNFGKTTPEEAPTKN